MMTLSINDLPSIIEATGWRWHTDKPSCQEIKAGMWIGSDADGNRWLVKMRGPEKAIRERTFASLAQALGISCQTSTYLLLPDNAPPLQTIPRPDPRQLAICHLPQHVDGFCNTTCPLRVLERQLRVPGADRIGALESSGLAHALDWVRADLLALLCGAWEAPQHLWTRSHQLVIIDNEEMWRRSPRRLEHCWWHRMSPQAAGISRVLCEQLARLTPRDFDRITTVPAPLDGVLDLRQRVQDTRDAAAAFLRNTGAVAGPYRSSK